jgi:hypothetical protein
MGKSIHPIGLFKVLRQALFACPVTRIIILLKYPFLSVFKTSFLNSVDIHWQETVGVVFLRHCIALRPDFLLVREESFPFPENLSGRGRHIR